MTLWVFLIVAISFTPAGEAVHVSTVTAFESRTHCERIRDSVHGGLAKDMPHAKIISGCAPIEKPVKS